MWGCYSLTQPHQTPLRFGDRLPHVVCHGPICVDHIFDLGAQMRPQLGREVFAHSYHTMPPTRAELEAIMSYRSCSADWSRSSA